MVTIPKEQYDPNRTYQFTDSAGNTFESKGDNGYVWQSITEGIPISRTSSGEWFTNPYLESNGNKVTAYIPEWFKNTDEYSTWQTYASQIPNISLTDDRVSSLKDILSQLGTSAATRTSLKNDIASYGVNTPELQDQYYKWMYAMGQEGAGNGKANLNGLFGSDKNESVADVARSFKNVSKEELSAQMEHLYDVLEQGRNGTWQGSEKEMLDSVTLMKMLNYVDDNYKNFGDKNIGENDEFKGLLEASTWQKLQASGTAFMQTMAENFPIINLPARAIYGLGQLAQGKPFSMEVERARNDELLRPDLGAYLEGTEASTQVGNVIGTVGNIAGTMTTSVMLGNLISAKAATLAPGNFLSKVGDFAKTIPGAMVTDFVVNDIPIDLTFFASDWARTGSVEKAWNNPEEQQPLFGIPIVGNFGPQVSNGLAMNLLGDAIIDVSLPVISVVGNTSFKKLDQWTSGGVTRTREKIAIENLKVQQKLTNLPVLGSEWQKFINHMMGAENAAFIREARKTAIAQGSMEPYIRAQNLLTVYNHAGMDIIHPLYKQLDESLNISSDLKKFAKEANKYGGVGNTEVSWKEARGGVEKTYKKVVPDTMPRQVKQTLLDTERLSELKGEIENEGGIIPSPARDREIAEIEERLSKVPDELKDFADRFSQLNKGVEQIGVELGITKQEWLDALNEDPRWKSYMTRQTLTPGGVGTASPGGSVNPADPAIINKARKGYYAENYLDPMLSLSMKTEAMGRAYAWNERAKALAEFQLARGKIAAGAGSIEAGQKLEQIKAQIKGTKELREKVGYDDTVKGVSNDASVVSAAFTKINELLHLPEKLNLKSIYDAQQSPRVKSFIDDYETGKVKVGDGVIEAAGISDSDFADIMRNTCTVEDLKDGGKSLMGVSEDGSAYKYTMSDNTISAIEVITDEETMAKVINDFGGTYHVTAETINEIGMANAKGINRTISYYRNNMPTLPIGPTYKMGVGHGSTFGWIPTPGLTANQGQYRFKVVDGHLEAEEMPVFLGDRYHKKGNEKVNDDANRDMMNSGFAPRNSDFPENTMIHETGHNMMARLAMLEINKRVDDGLLTLPEDTTELNKIVYEQWKSLHERLGRNALEQLGVTFSDTEWKRQASTISGYAGSGDYLRKTYRYETFSEAMVDYRANGDNASKFTLAIVEQMRKTAERFSIAIDPGVVFRKNGLDAPKGLFVGDQYAFPKTTKTDAGRAKWLDKWRQNNPYLKGKGLFTEEQYQKANLWDTYFQKEIRAYNSKSKSSMPDALTKKNGEFLEDLSRTSAKRMVEEIRKSSIEGFDEEIATMALSRNSKDIAEAMETFIIKRVNKAAEEIAAKMPGGLTTENLNRARATLWAEDIVKNDITNMVATLAPDAGFNDIQKSISRLFDEQAKGFTSVDALPVESKKLIEEQRKLEAEIVKNNNYALKQGRDADKKRTGYVGDTTQMIHYKQGGEDIYVMVSDPVTASILKRPTEYKDTGVAVEALAQASNFLSRTYRIGTTGISPLAFVRNVLRDPMQATIQGGFNPLNMSLSPDVFYHTLRGYGLDDDTITEVTNRLNRWASSSTLTQEMRDMGQTTPGRTGYRNRAEQVSRKLDKVTSLKIIEAMEAPLDSWESLFRNQIAQQSFIKNFERTGDVNKAMGAAMFDASNSTTNFSHSVGLFKRATSTVPYLSSAINGTRSFWVQFNADPIGMITRITAGFMVPAMAITAWNLSSEDRKNTYVNLPEWYRDSHIVLLDLDGKIISFPIPEELQQFYGTARRLIEYTNDVNRQGIPTILAQGAFGFLPTDVDGYFKDDGSIDMGRGTVQMMSGLIPQAVTAVYEFIAEKDLYTGQDLSSYNGLNKTINTLSNLFGTGVKNWANDIGMMMGVPSDQLIGKSTMDTLARDLFGMGFDDATNQFMAMIGSPSSVSTDGKEKKATGLFAENEQLQKQIEGLNKKIAVSTGDTKAKYERQKQELIDNFTERVSGLVNNYMNLYTHTGGLEDWQKAKIVSILTLGSASSSSASDTYQYADVSQAYLSERGLAQQRYVNAGLPAGPSEESVLSGNQSIALQAAINRFYGSPRQAAADFTNALKESGLKNIRTEFYNAVSKIYDLADETGTEPDYDLIEKIQARYLQAVDGILIPIIQQYGINILNSNDFINEVRNYVNGMVPSNDWRQSGRNAKKYLSKKDFPLATVDVKKWLIDRYSSNIKNRNIASDSTVTQQLNAIKEDIDAGRTGAARGRINSLKSGIQKANFYISSEDMLTLNQYNNMVK